MSTLFRPIKEAWSSSKSKPCPAYGVTTDIDIELSVSTTDLYENMKIVQSEYVSPKTHNPTATFLPFRRYLVDWMSDVGEQFNLHPTTIHTAILFLDKIFREDNNTPVPPRAQWQLLATACLSVASKYEEAEEHCPPIPDLLEVTKLYAAGHTPLSFRDGETDVLMRLNWTLRAVCPLHVVGYYLSKGVTFTEDKWQGRPLIEKIPKYVKKYTEFFCNFTLQEYSFQQYLPSLLAAAIVMASRVAIHLEPRWRPELEALTGYSEAEIEPAFNAIFKYYEEQFPGHGARSVSPKSVEGL